MKNGRERKEGTKTKEGKTEGKKTGIKTPRLREEKVTARPVGPRNNRLGMKKPQCCSIKD